MARDWITPPAFEDTGYDGSWFDALSHTSLLWCADGLTLCNAAFLDALDDAPSGQLQADALPGADVLSSFHEIRNNSEARHDHVIG